MRRRLGLELAPVAEQAIRALAPEPRRRVRAAIDTLRDEPELGEELHEELAGSWRLRVGRLRVVYRIRGRLLQVVAVGPRATIYTELAARLRKERKRGGVTPPLPSTVVPRRRRR